MKTYLLILFACTNLCLATAVQGHNGEVAFAAPLAAISIDGDLSDWPPSSQYTIERVGLGSSPKDAADFAARFRVGWDGSTASLYVAVEVEDDQHVGDGESPTSMRQMSQFLQRLGWRDGEVVDPPRLPDGCAVIIDMGHGDRDSRSVRFAYDGDSHRYVLTSSERDSSHWRAAEVGTRLSAGRRVYEWRLDLHDPFLRESDIDLPELSPGTVIGFDVTVTDADDDGSLSWITWGPSVGKMWGGRRTGRADLVLMNNGVQFGKLSGRTGWTDSLATTPPVGVEAQTAGGARWKVATDATGGFELLAPAGDYVVTLDDPRLSLDRHQVQVTIPAGDAAQQVVVIDRPLYRLRPVATDGIAPSAGEPPPTGKQRGMSWVGGRMVGRQHLSSLGPTHVDWIVQTPFGWQRDIHKSTLRSPDGESGGWGESDRGVVITAALAREQGIATLLKPHLWTGRGTWRGELAMTSEQDWAEWFAQYEFFILHFARLAEANQIEGLCIGTELSATLEREDQWRQMIERVRQVYGGWIVYAANWTSFEDVPFWDAVDFVGVQGYFPLSKEPTADVDDLIEGWQPWLERLEQVALRADRRVLFTEIGYRANKNAAVEPWLWPRQTEGGGDAEGLRTQDACYEAFFRAVWSRPWIAGAYFWKWFPNHERAGGEGDGGFTPQRKPAQATLTKWYRRSLVLDRP
ncbi:MAG TPA: hypothetical protein DIC52_05100 [Candidatus Latescibacteria bacterium]|nr:hypothetical protein [Candidatus Latescibacterota bacterium]